MRVLHVCVVQHLVRVVSDRSRHLSGPALLPHLLDRVHLIRGRLALHEFLLQLFDEELLLELNVVFLCRIAHEILIQNWRSHVAVSAGPCLVEVRALENLRRVHGQPGWWYVGTHLHVCNLLTHTRHVVIVLACLVSVMARDGARVVLRVVRDVASRVEAVSNTR